MDDLNYRQQEDDLDVRENEYNPRHDAIATIIVMTVCFVGYLIWFR